MALPSWAGSPVDPLLNPKPSALVTCRTSSARPTCEKASACAAVASTWQESVAADAAAEEADLLAALYARLTEGDGGEEASSSSPSPSSSSGKRRHQGANGNEHFCMNFVCLQGWT